MPGKKGGKHGPSIKAATMYEGLKRKGMSKSKAAAISNAWARDDGKVGPGKKGGKKGKK